MSLTSFTVCQGEACKAEACQAEAYQAKACQVEACQAEACQALNRVPLTVSLIMEATQIAMLIFL